MSTVRLSALLTVVCFALLAAPAVHADTSGSDIVGLLNAERAASGLPAVTEDAGRSASCADWVSGRVLSSPPGWPYGVPGVASTFATGMWTADYNPFDRHPFVLPELLAPRLVRIGAAHGDKAGCVQIDPTGSTSAPATDVTYPVPGDGAQDVRTSQTSPTNEIPGTLDQQSALTPTETGSYLYAFFDGPDFDAAGSASAKATAASLTGPDGAVAVNTYDSTTPNFPTSLPTEVQVVPQASLKPFAHYTASVTADVTVPGGALARPFTRTWSFTTGALENAAGLGYGGGAITAGDPSLVTFEVQSRAPTLTLSATGPGTPASVTTTIAVGTYIPQWATLRLDRPGAWHVCVRSGGTGTDFRSAEGCRDLTAGAVPKAPVKPPVVTPAPKPAKLVVSLGKGAKARWSGRTVSVPVRCTAKCSLRVAGTVRAGGKNIKLGTKNVARKSAGTVTVKYTLSKAAARRLRAAKVRRLTLTVTAKGATTVRKTVAISAK